MRVHFTDVGRGKATFTTTIPVLDHANLEAAVRSKAQIRSRDLDFDMPDNTHGTVIVGGFRAIGTFTVEPDASELN